MFVEFGQELRTGEEHRAGQASVDELVDLGEPLLPPTVLVSAAERLPRTLDPQHAERQPTLDVVGAAVDGRDAGRPGRGVRFARAFPPLPVS